MSAVPSRVALVRAARSEVWRRARTSSSSKQARRPILCAISNRAAEVAEESNGSSNNGSAATASQGRQGSVRRTTKETKVEVSIDLDGTGKCDSDTGIPFLDHMMDQIASHGLFDLKVIADGDTHIDDHHTCEDIALALGQALSQALGDRKGIYRFGNFSAPLDEALIQVVLDLSGRPHLGFQCDIPAQRVGNFDTELVEHFYQSLANTGGITLHIRKLDGRNSHHIIEASFKAFARALRQAVEIDPRRVGQVPSSKGVLTQK